MEKNTIGFRVDRDKATMFKRVILAIYWEDDCPELHRINRANHTFGTDYAEFHFITNSDRDVLVATEIGFAMGALVKSIPNERSI